ncbi:MAG: type I methionyl aminopeptidase [Bacteroidia bacterium]|nr:type I methionyl aminopeptidase [Bacteroidia bacterium]
MTNSKLPEEIELLKISNLLASKTLGEIAKLMTPGMNIMAIDKRAEEFIRDNMAEPVFLGYRGFPNALCISINDMIVHGIPTWYELKEGDIVSVDCGTRKNGYVGDIAYTFPIGEIDEKVQTLIKVTKEALYKGIENATEGKRIGDIGFAIQQHVEKYGFSVVRELVGHGVGKYLHEKPEVPNFGKRGNGTRLFNGMVIAIEPMINMGLKDVKKNSGEWNIKTADGKPSAHYEHTVVVRKDKAEILTTFEYIENELIKTGFVWQNSRL